MLVGFDSKSLRKTTNWTTPTATSRNMCPKLHLSIIPAKTHNSILLPKLFGPTIRKNCSRDRENFLKFEAEGQEFEIVLRSLEQFIQKVKGRNKFL